VITQEGLEALGWTFDTVDGTGAKNGDVLCIVSAPDFPLFALIRAANHLEGDDELMDEPITAELVLQVSGETWTPPPLPPPPVATGEDAHLATREIVTANLAEMGVTIDQLAPTFDSLLAEAKSAIPYYEGYTLQPDPTTAWTNFQALDQATKDRLLYNCCRSLAALMRFLSGDLQPPAA
jgi:hypothetical protein